MHPDLEKLVAAKKLSAPVAETLSRLEPGTYVLHSGWGAGKIEAWDLMNDKVVVDFESKPGHELKLEFAAKSLIPLAPQHVLARRVADPAGISEMAIKEAPAFVRLVLESYGRSMLLDQFEQVVKPKIVSEARFKAWWDSTKKALRQDKSFVVPSKRTIPMELRAEDITHTDALMGDFRQAKDLKDKIKAADAVLLTLTDFQGSEKELQELVATLDDTANKAMRMSPAHCFEMLLIRDELMEKVPATKAQKDNWQPLSAWLIQERKSMVDVAKTLPLGRLRQWLSVIPTAFGEEWLKEGLNLMNSVTGRTVGEVATLILNQGKEEELTQWLRTSLNNRTLTSDTLQWLCRERSDGSADVFDAELAPALISALELEHYQESNRKSGRLVDLVVSDKDLLADLARQMDLRQTKSFARRLMSSPVFDDLTRRSLLARLIRVYPEVQELIEHPEASDTADDVLVVSNWSFEERKKAFDHLCSYEIPQNRKDIEIAKAYGDLRENFEFKSAREQSRVLSRRRDMMQREFDRARPTDFSDARSDVVSIGVIVDVRAESGEIETFTILGAWDTDAGNKVVSYLSVLGRSLMQKPVGAVCELPTEDGGRRLVTITAIRKYVRPEPEA